MCETTKQEFATSANFPSQKLLNQLGTSTNTKIMNWYKWLHSSEFNCTNDVTLVNAMFKMQWFLKW